tara:strand:+ start:58 stop:306 length:249 start_codon:yes stop_codon:yes gene_type:complete
MIQHLDSYGNKYRVAPPAHKQAFKAVLENIQNCTGKTLCMDLNLLHLWKNGGSSRSEWIIEGWEDRVDDAPWGTQTVFMGSF